MQAVAEQANTVKVSTHAKSLFETIGNTPLLRFSKVTRAVPAGVRVLAKAEHLNPGGSVKDRAARAMILAALESGELGKDKIMLDATSGNTGIAYAMIAASLGLRLQLCLPENANVERKRTLKSYGAQLIETPALDGADGAQRAAQKLALEHPSKYFYIDQYNNRANRQTHYEQTAIEIWEQTNRQVTHFLAGLGTTGTFIGVSSRLKELNKDVRAIQMQPDSPLHGLEGMRHLETSIVPGIYDASVADETIEVSTEAAQAMTRRLAREEGLLVGISSGANLHAALEYSQRLPAGSCLVTILCDTGARYLSSDLWDVK